MQEKLYQYFFILKWAIAILVLSISSKIYAQKHVRYSEDSIVIPVSVKRKVVHIIKKDSTASEKLTDICNWICKHKKYDTKGYEKLRLNEYSLLKTLRKNKLSCHEYAHLMEAMCRAAGITCYNVDGYSKGMGNYFYQNNEWNVVKIDGQYRIIDLCRSSGYLKTKKSLWGMIRKLIGLPYIPKKRKFIKEFDPYYLNVPPKQLVLNYLPLLPMWQLDSFPISIHTFENETIPMCDTTSIKYPFMEAIQNYSGRTIHERILLMADQGYAFNPKNNWNKGIYYLQYAYKDWESLEKKRVSLLLMNTRSQQIKKYASGAEMYLKRFLNDNKRIKKQFVDSITLKHKEIEGFIKRQQTICLQQSRDANRKIRINNRKNILARIAILRNRAQCLARTKNNGIYRAKRSTKGNNLADTLKIIQNAIEKNDMLIENLDTCIGPVLNLLDNIEEKINACRDTLFMCEHDQIKLIKKAMYLDLKTNENYAIREIHTNIDSIKLKIISLNQEIIELKNKFQGKLLKCKDSLVTLSIVKAMENKSLLIRHKNLYIEDINEQEQYTNQNDVIVSGYNQYNESFNYLTHARLRENKFNKLFIKKQNKVNKAFKKYTRFKMYVMRRRLGHENFRYKKYDANAKRAIAISIQLQDQATVVMKGNNRIEKKH